MSVEAGVIFVSLPSDRTSADVVEAIAGYWEAHGAHVESAPAGGLPETSLRVTGADGLGFLVARRRAGIVAVLDSEGYTADPQLARALSKALKAPTCAIELAGALDDAALKAYGKWPKKPAGKGYVQLEAVAHGLDPERFDARVDTVDDPGDWHVLWLRGVDPSQYATVPFPSRKRRGPRPPWALPARAAWNRSDPVALAAVIERFCGSLADRVLMLFDDLRRHAYHALHQAAHGEESRTHLEEQAALFVHAGEVALANLDPAGFAASLALPGCSVISLVELLFACRISGQDRAFERFATLCGDLRVDLSDDESLGYLVEYLEMIGEAEIGADLFDAYRSRVGLLCELVEAFGTDPQPDEIARIAAHPHLRAHSLYNRAAEAGAAGHHDLALTLLEEAARRERPPWQVFNNALAHALLGATDGDDLRARAAPWIERGAHLLHHPDYLHNLACVRAELGEGEAAIDLLRRALDAGASPDILADASFDDLRELPEFQGL